MPNHAPTGMNIMQAITGLLTGLTENIQRGRAEQQRGFQFLAGQPGAQVTPAVGAERAGIFSRLLGLPEYQTAPGAGPTISIGGVPMTVTSWTPERNQAFLESLGAPTAGGSFPRPAAIPTASVTGPGAPVQAPTAPGEVPSIQLPTVTVRPRTASESTVSAEELRNDPVVRALLTQPGDQRLAIAQRRDVLIEQKRKGLVESRAAAREEREFGMKQLEQTMKQAEFLGRLMVGVKDQESYDTARVRAARQLPPEVVEGLPEVYSAEAVQQLIEEAQTVKDRTELARKELEERTLGPIRSQEAVARAVATERATGPLVEARQARVAERTGVAAAERQMDRYLTPEEAGRMGQPIGTRMSDLRAKGMVPPPATEAQGMAIGYGSRMQNADRITTMLEATAPQVQSAISRGAAQIPYIGNFLAPAKVQQYNQAKRDFALAVLRRESGAAISAEEYDTVDKTYFSQPGDSAEVLKQKQATRRAAIQAIQIQAGRQLPEVPPAPGGTAGPGAPVTPTPTAKRATQADIAVTMQSSGKSREEVIRLLKGKGYTIEGER